MSEIRGNMIDCETEHAGGYPQVLHIRTHALRADVGPDSGSTDSAPSPHDYFDAALAACKALTATLCARRHGIPLERVESHVERDNGEERQGRYHLRVRLVFHGPMSEAQRTAVARAAAACPIHKLMTSAEINIETVT